MHPPPDYYRLLHVQPDAPVEITRMSYRTLMQRLKHHPDLGGDHAQAALINEAYATLTDPKKRASYDRTRERADQPAPAQEHAAQAKTATAQRPAGSAESGACSFYAMAYSLGATLTANTRCARCDSPLHRAGSPRLEDSQRLMKRMPQQRPIMFFLHWRDEAGLYGEAADISLNGMRFSTSHQLSAEQVIKIECDVCTAVARVINFQPGSTHHIAGVEFITVSFPQPQGSFVSETI